MSQAFDAERYTRTPSVNVATGVTLACALLSAMPRDISGSVKKAAQQLREETLRLQSEWVESEKIAKPGDPRPADRAIDNGWSALHDRLDAYASLPGERYPRAARAAELFGLIFPRGLTFLKLPYAEEWTESENRLQRIASEEMARDVDELAGPEFLAEIRLSHQAYGRALGVDPHGEPTELGEALRRVTVAIHAYALQVAATVDPDREASVRVALDALRPLDEHRVHSGRTSVAPGLSSTGATPSTFVPEIPA